MLASSPELLLPEPFWLETEPKPIHCDSYSVYREQNVISLPVGKPVQVFQSESYLCSTPCHAHQTERLMDPAGCKAR